MYLNVLSLKNGLRLSFTDETPYSVDKIAPGWNIVTDVKNGASISFVGTEVVHVGSQKLDAPKNLKINKEA